VYRNGCDPANSATGCLQCGIDIISDINEAKNLATENPEIVKKLTGLLKTFDAEIKANLRPPGKA